MKPKFSIIVGVYNQKDTLPALIDSLNRQTFRDFEVHFCDDGSDDGSREYFEKKILFAGADKRRIEREPEFPDNNFTYFYHRQPHQGMRLARNLNQGIKKANGQYCLFVMGDSMLETDYLEILNNWVDPDRVVCGIRVQIDKMANGNYEGVDIDWRLKKKVVPEVPSVIMSYPWLSFTGNGLTISTEAFRRHGLWMEEIEGYGGEDNEIVARLYFKGYVCWSVPDLRVYHHWHKAQESSQTNTNKIAEKIKTYEL